MSATQFARQVVAHAVVVVVVVVVGVGWQHFITPTVL